MRIGINQKSLGTTDVNQLFARAKKVQVQGIGLNYEDKKQAKKLADTEHIDQLNSLVDANSIAITGLHLGVLCESPSLLLGANVPASQEVILQGMRMSQKLGKPDVIVPFFGQNRIEFPKELETVTRAIEELVESAEEMDVVIAIESTLHLNQIQSLVADCGSTHVKAVVDVGEWTACKYDVGGMIRGLELEEISQVHVKDVRKEKGLPPDYNVRLGRGDVRFSEVASALSAIKYDGWVVLETPPGDDDGEIVNWSVGFVKELFERK